MSSSDRTQAPPSLSAADARALANYVALSPFLFQAVAVMRDTGFLAAVYGAPRRGLSIEQGAEASGLSAYAVEILRDLGHSVGLFRLTDDGAMRPTTLTHFLLHDSGVAVNFRFSQHFAWGGLARLREALETGEPEGLKTFGDWDVLYPHLMDLPSPAKEAWFDFDHHYSDSAFDHAIDVLLAGHRPGTLLDIGANTGRFARRLLARDSAVRVVLQDLPAQLAVARQQMSGAEGSARAQLHACDVLEADQPFHQGADAAWMSQFLCCFSLPQVTTILRRAAAAIPSGAPLYILDTFWDRQAAASGAYSLHATSLYFACFANGEGKMYAATDILRCASEAGLVLVGDYNGLGKAHTLLVLKSQ